MQVPAPPGNAAHNSQRHQGQQCAAGRQLRAVGGRFRVREADPGGGEPHDDASEGHAGVPGAGIRDVGESVGELRRLQLRNPSAGDRHGEEAHREASGRNKEDHHGVGGAAHKRRPP